MLHRRAEGHCSGRTLVLLAVALLLGSLAPASAAGLPAPWSLPSGAGVSSPNGRYVVQMQGDGNLVESLVSGSSRIVQWNSRTWGHPGAHAELGTDAILRVMADGTELWRDPGAVAPAAGRPGQITLYDDGRLVTATSNGFPLWANLNFGSSLTGGSGVLGSGQRLESPLGLAGASAFYSLEMQSDGNLVEYANGVPYGPRAVWNAGTWNHPGSYARLSTDGHLQVIDTTGAVLYGSTNTASPANLQPARITLFDDSRLIIQTSNGFPLWSSIMFGSSLAPGASLLPGQRIVGSDGALGMSSDGALVAWGPFGSQSWATPGPPMPGATATMQTDGNLVVRDRAGTPIWASGTGGYPGSTAAFSPGGSPGIYRGGALLFTISQSMRDTIVARAMSQVGYTVSNWCNAFSAYWGDGVPCNGGRSQAWCADFAAWAWATSGVTGMDYPRSPNGFPISWRNWATPRGIWRAADSGYQLKPGDIVVYGLDLPDRLGHVAIATGTLTNGYPDTVNGDFGGFITSVEYNRGLRISDPNDPRTVIAGYITPY